MFDLRVDARCVLLSKISVVDVYSFGMLLYELVTERKPYNEVNSAVGVHANVIAGVVPPLPAALISRCWIRRRLIGRGRHCMLGQECCGELGPLDGCFVIWQTIVSGNIEIFERYVQPPAIRGDGGRGPC